jgi:Tol biopolymer transport system component/DNA-binding winged helix-turn-helix (wHTH) protein
VEITTLLDGARAWGRIDQMSSNEVPHRVRFGPYEADLRTHELFKHGTRLKLSGQPFQILEVLLSRPSELITRDELRDKLWPEDTFVDFSHGLNAAVNKLRDALSDSADNPKYIETLPRRGYRFIGKIEGNIEANTEGQIERKTEAKTELPARPEVVVESPPPPREPDVPPFLEPQAEEEDAPHRRNWRPVLIGVAVCFIFVFLLLLLVVKHLSQGNGRTEAMEAAYPAGRVHPVVNVPDSLSDPALSPDGNQIAFRRKGSSPSSVGLFVKAVGSDDMIQLTRSPADANPVWSPDGKSIAFVRSIEGQWQIFLMPSTGGEPRQVSTPGPHPNRIEIDWSSDANTIAFSGSTSDGSSAIFLLSLNSEETQQLTHPQVGAFDWGPAFSPDGQHVSFVRSQPGGFPEDLYLTNITGTDLHQLTSEHAHILGPPAWSSDGHYVMYATTKAGEPTLWRVPVPAGEPRAVDQVGANVWHPSISRRGFRLAFQQIRSASSILQMGIGPDAGSRKVVTSTRGRNEGPALSPDGKRLAFMSNRSGTMEIWVSSPDGSNAVQLTALDGAGTPRWSPDSKTIAFDSRLDERGAIFTVLADGGTARPLVHENSENLVPSYSRDGRWIYFGSDRGGDWQLWKVSVEGGSPMKVTQRGGFAAMEGPDGYLYYALNRFPNPEIWRVPIGGAGETQVSPKIVPRTWASWAVAPTGIYFVEDTLDAGPVLSFYDFSKKEIRRIAQLEKAPFWLSVSADGSTLFMDMANQEESSIMMLENFH